MHDWPIEIEQPPLDEHRAFLMSAKEPPEPYDVRGEQLLCGVCKHEDRLRHLGAVALILVVFLYRLLTVYTVRSGECRPQAVDPSLRRLTRDEHGTPVGFPERTGFPPQRWPLVVMTYNIAGHDELTDGDHVREIAAAIRRIRPDIVALQEVHRKTWQARFRDQLAEL